MNLNTKNAPGLAKEVRRVIFVDDNKSEFFLSEKIFKEFMPQAKLMWFPDGDKFLQFLKLETSDLSETIVLMDVNMPGKGAKEILEEMQKEGLIGKVSIVVMSVFQKLADQSFFTRFNGISFVKKPCGLAEYSQFINSLLKYLK